MAPRSSLSDDWEDVGDDNLSVISLPTSDTEETPSPVSDQPVQSKPTSPKRTSPSPSNIPGPAKNSEFTIPIRSVRRHSPRQPPIITEPSVSGTDKASIQETAQEETKSSQEKGKSIETLLAPPCKIADDEHPENPFRDPSSSECIETEDPQEGDYYEDSQDVNPVVLQTAVRSLSEVLRDTSHALRTFPGSGYMGAKSIILIHQLSNQVSELDPIVSGYAKLWPSARDIPLDPGLSTWLEEVRVKLVSFQTQFHKLANDSRYNSPFNSPPDPTLIQLWMDLEGCQKKMIEFLPIMQVDYNEFQTERMTLPGNMNGAGDLKYDLTPSLPIDIPKPSSPSCGTTGGPSFQGPSNEVWLLRHELYQLKDAIKKTVSALTSASTSISDDRLAPATSYMDSRPLRPSSSEAELAKDVAHRYGSLFNQITLVLSNHGSEWIESGLAGGLSYAEFVQLDVGSIRGITSQLNATLDDPEQTAKWGREEHYGLDKTAQQWETRNAVLSTEKMETLEMLASVLEATILPRRP